MKRHETDGVSLAFGLIFLGITAWWTVTRFVELDIPNLGWIAAVALIVFGLLGVVLSLRNGRRTAVEPVDDSNDTVDETHTT